MAHSAVIMDNASHQQLNRQDYKTLSLAALGGALEFYDFIVFVFFAPVISQLFFPTDIPEWLRQLQTFGIFAAGYLARPLGGIVMAHFGDLVGRKKMFSLSILLMALPTLGMGLLPTYATIGIAAPVLLLLLRLLQGAAIGGEVPGAWVFVAEHVPAKRLGIACGILTSGLTLGILVGSLLASVLNMWMSQAQILSGGWRIPFFIGGLFGFIAMYLRRWLKETPVFVAMQARKQLAKELPLKSIMQAHKKSVVLSMMLTWLLSAGVVVVVLMSPSYLQQVYGIAPALTLQANSLATVMLMLGCIVAGGIADRLGLGKTFIGGSLLLAACSGLFYTHAADSTVILFASYALAGFSVGVTGLVPCVMVRAFPPAVRFSGISLSYNIAYAIFGGLTPILVTSLMKLTPLAPALYVLFLSMGGVLMGGYLLRYLRGKEQSEDLSASEAPSSLSERG